MIQGVLLQPASIKNKVVREHLERTIFNYVRMDEILMFVKAIKNSEYNEFLVWGVVPGQSQKQWEKLKDGDLVAFYSERRFYLLGQVLEKLHSPDLAKYLWGVDSKGRSWEYIYLIDPDTLLEIDIPLSRVVEILGYKETFILQSALYTDKHEVVDLFLKDPLNFQRKSSSGETLTEIVKREKILATIQRIKRDRSFSTKVKENYQNRCAICDIPNEGSIIDAAHVKPVNAGGPDIEENGISLCKLHHYLFDAGLIGIKNGKLVVSNKMSSKLKNHPMIKNFANKKIQLIKTSENFLNWHLKNVFK